MEQRRECARGNFVFPGPDISAAFEYQGRQVGRIDFGISPLGDRLYISDFQIWFPRQGLGLAALWRLSQHYRLPLASMHELGVFTAFWDKAERRLRAAGVHLQRNIRTGDQKAIMATSAHLVPEPEHERLIREYRQWVAAERAAGREAGPGIPRESV